MPGNLAAQDNSTFRGYRTTRTEATISEQNRRIHFHSLFVAGVRAQIVDNVNEAEAVCLQEQCHVRVFFLLDLACCVG